jgi:hypothetical protein
MPVRRCAEHQAKYLMGGRELIALDARASRSSGPPAPICQSGLVALHHESVGVLSKVEVRLWLLAMTSWSKETDIRERRSDGLNQELVG